MIVETHGTPDAQDFPPEYDFEAPSITGLNDIQQKATTADFEVFTAIFNQAAVLSDSPATAANAEWFANELNSRRVVLARMPSMTDSLAYGVFSLGDPKNEKKVVGIVIGSGFRSLSQKMPPEDMAAVIGHLRAIAREQESNLGSYVLDKPPSTLNFTERTHHYSLKPAQDHLVEKPEPAVSGNTADIPQAGAQVRNSIRNAFGSFGDDKMQEAEQKHPKGSVYVFEDPRYTTERGNLDWSRQLWIKIYQLVDEAEQIEQDLGQRQGLVVGSGQNTLSWQKKGWQTFDIDSRNKPDFRGDANHLERIFTGMNLFDVIHVEKLSGPAVDSSSEFPGVDYIPLAHKLAGILKPNGVLIFTMIHNPDNPNAPNAVQVGEELRNLGYEVAVSLEEPADPPDPKSGKSGKDLLRMAKVVAKRES